MRNYKQGIFTPKNPQKYRGDVKTVTFRSSWEMRVMKWLDETPSVLEWASEEAVVLYESPIDLEKHRYFVDFYARIKTSTGETKSYLIEIKPEKETIEPKKGKKLTKRYIQELTTWGVNQAKWKAATEFAKDRGWSFLVLTEKNLGI